MKTKLKEFLDDNGMRQEHVAKKLNMNPHTIHNIVSGKTEPSLKNAVAIEDFTKGFIKPRDMILSKKVRKKYEKKAPPTQAEQLEL